MAFSGDASLSVLSQMYLLWLYALSKFLVLLSFVIMICNLHFLSVFIV